MIKTEKCYTAYCDKCGERFTDETFGLSTFTDRDALNDMVHEKENGWVEFNGELYCPKCASEHLCYDSDNEQWFKM